MSNLFGIEAQAKAFNELIIRRIKEDLTEDEFIEWVADMMYQTSTHVLYGKGVLKDEQN